MTKLLGVKLASDLHTMPAALMPSKCVKLLYGCLLSKLPACHEYNALMLNLLCAPSSLCLIETWLNVGKLLR